MKFFVHNEHAIDRDGRGGVRAAAFPVDVELRVPPAPARVSASSESAFALWMSASVRNACATTW